MFQSSIVKPSGRGEATASPPSSSVTAETGSERWYITPHASLAAVGQYVQQHDVFGPIHQQVHIPQKTLRYAPTQKLYAAWVALLLGARSLVEVNTRLRPDVAVQQAFGQVACADQSVIHDTLAACTAQTVQQMEQALDTIFRQHAQAYQHAYRRTWQVLDVDMSGMPCGPKAALACHGYFGRQHRKRRGRQLGRVVASAYDEVVVDRLYSGTTQLTTALQPLVQAAETTLALDAPRRHRTILRMDAGGGSVKDVNWLLARGYHVHGKVYQHRLVDKFIASVKTWYDDPKVKGRQVGRVEHTPSEYVRSVSLVAARRRLKNGQWRRDVIVSTLPPAAVLKLVGRPLTDRSNERAVLLAYLAFYDQRGGGVEMAFKSDKQGLGLTSRSMKRFEAQQMLVYLTTLAHNVLVWTRRLLAEAAPRLAHYGMLRLVRDVWSIPGWLAVDPGGRLRALVLLAAHPLAAELGPSLAALISPEQTAVYLGQT